MTPQARRTLLRHAVAADLVVLATGIAYLVPDSALVVFAAFFAAVAVSAWVGREEVGLAATAYSVLVVAIFFGNLADVTTLTLFAAACAALAAFVRVIRTTRVDEAALPAPDVSALPFTFGLPLLVVVVYTDISNVIMSRYPVPSLLQPVIALLAVAVWKYRDRYRAGSVALQPIPFLFSLYALVIFATSIRARELYLADERLSEMIKAFIICVLVGALAATWSALRRSMAAMVAAAAFLSAMSVIQITTGKLNDAFFGIVFLKEANIYENVDLMRAAGPPVAEPNFYARILVIAIPIAVALAVASERRRWQALYAAAACIITAGVLVTYSRGAMLAMGGMAVLAALALRIRVRTMIATAVGGLLVLSVLPGDLVGKRLGTLAALLPGSENAASDGSVDIRMLYLRAGLAMFDAHPIAGVGAGQFGPHYFQYANIVGSPVFDFIDPGVYPHPHGLWLEIASETGIIGLIVFGSAIVAALLAMWRARRDLLARGEPRHAVLAIAVGIGLCGYLAASIFLHDTYLRYVGLYLGFAAGVVKLQREHAAEEGDA